MKKAKVDEEGKLNKAVSEESEEEQESSWSEETKK